MCIYWLVFYTVCSWKLKLYTDILSYLLLTIILLKIVLTLTICASPFCMCLTGSLKRITTWWLFPLTPFFLKKLVETPHLREDYLTNCYWFWIVKTSKFNCLQKVLKVECWSCLSISSIGVYAIVEEIYEKITIFACRLPFWLILGVRQCLQ